MRLRIAVYCSLEAALRLNEGAGDYASRVIAVRGDATAALELLDALLAVGATTRPQPGRPPSGVNRNGHAPARANGNGSGNGGNGNGRLPDNLRLPSGADRSDSGAGELLRRG